MKQFGVDISRYQGNFDFSAAVREGVQFVIIKGGGADDGYYIDSKYERNYEEAKKLRLPVGVYWFSRALSAEDAIKEADYFYDHIVSGRQFELPVFIDVEHRRMLALDKSYLTTIVKTWCDKMEEKGCWAGIYSSLSAFRSEMDDDRLQDYTHWVAQWSSVCDYTKTSLGFWQFGGETNVLRSNQVAGQVCDQDYMYRDFPAMIRAAGLNGYSKTPATDENLPANGGENETIQQPLKSITEIAHEVIEGKWGNGKKRKALLKEAGYDPTAVQNEVNRLLGIGRKTPEEIAEEVLQGKWGNGLLRKLRLKKAGYDPGMIQAIVNKMLYQ